MSQSTHFTLSLWTIVWRSLLFFRRSHLSLCLGIAAATAVIVGALVVGDSMRGSLRNLVLQRLSNTTHILQSRQFFSVTTIAQLNAKAIDPSLSLSPIILLTNGSAESSQTHDGSDFGVATQVQLLAVDESFWSALDSQGRSTLPKSFGPNEIAINEALARELRATVGDLVTLRLSRSGGIPADSPLGRRNDGPINLPRQKVVAIVSDQSIGGMQLQSNQQSTFNAFASLGAVQDLLEVGEKVNAALVLTNLPSQSADSRELIWMTALNEQLRPTIEDHGLQWQHHTRVFPDVANGETASQDDAIQNADTQIVGGNDSTTIFDYFQLSSTELLIDRNVVTTVIKTLWESDDASVPSFEMVTYLANTLSKVNPPNYDFDRSNRPLASEAIGVDLRAFPNGSREVMQPIGRTVPYSIVVGVGRHDSNNQPSPYNYLNLWQYSQMSELQQRVPYGWVNSWLAKQLDVKPGDWIQMQYYEPETIDGDLRESTVRLRVAGILPLEEPDQPYRRNRPAIFSRPPTEFNDPDLTPVVPGITNQESISNWDVPFELTYQDLILPEDDKYWADYRLTPKLFLPLRFARELFHSRFGSTTAIRIANTGSLDEHSLRQRIEEALLSTRSSAGFEFQPVRYQQLKAATGTTPFDGLFLSLSSFVIVAALLLVALLFKLGVQQRTPQFGLLLAQGFRPSQIRKLIMAEMAVVAVIGAMIGIPIGLAYAQLMIAGLETWWIGAIQDRFLAFHARPISLLVGVIIGITSSLATIYLSFRALARIEPLRLMRGEHGDSYSPANIGAGEKTGTGSTIDRHHWQAWLGLAGICFIAACLLVAFATSQIGMARAGCFFGSGMLLLIGSLLAVRSWFYRSGVGTTSGLPSLAYRAISRNPVRSSMSIGMLAVASFLITSMSVFKVSSNPEGFGSFDLVGVSSQPIYENLGSPSARAETIGTKAERLLGSTIIPIRMNEGDDASCTNLFQVSQPTILGLSDKLQKLSELTAGFNFSWAATSQPESPLSAIQRFGTGDPATPIPVILDQNTALWSLKQGGRLNSDIKLEFNNKTIHFRVVGLLSNSIFQGKLIISERNFENLFPKISGCRYFLIRSSDNVPSNEVASLLEEGWRDAGMDVTPSETILARLLGVQNTYISAFQSLGALGLLLGTLGLVAVQIRSVLERRSELALMQAVGFSKWRLSRLLTFETALLLFGGLLIGVLCSALALIPYAIEVGPELSIASPLAMLSAVLVCGFVAAALAARRAMKLPLLDSLRGR